jgi:hypothetical protein
MFYYSFIGNNSLKFYVSQYIYCEGLSGNWPTQPGQRLILLVISTDSYYDARIHE